MGLRFLRIAVVYLLVDAMPGGSVSARIQLAPVQLPLLPLALTIAPRRGHPQLPRGRR